MRRSLAIRTESPEPASRQTVEVGLLAAFMFFMPLVEAPKNIVGAVYLLYWLWRRASSGHWGHPWGWWDSLIAASMLMLPIGAALSGLRAHEWGGVIDPTRYLILLWGLSRSKLSLAEWRTVLIALVAGTLLAGAWGAWVMWRSNILELELNSVGHSNHSAIFACLVFGAAVAWLIARWVDMSVRERGAWVVAVLLLGLTIIGTGSRVAVVVAAISAALLAAAQSWRVNNWKPVALVAGAMLLATLLVAMTEPWVLRKHQRNVSDDNVLAFRGPIWDRALTAWRTYPWFGIGQDNFREIDSARYRAWLERQGRPYAASADVAAPHAHSLYLQALAERGAIGSIPLFLLLLAWLAALVHWRPRRNATTDAGLWGASASGWLITMGIGVVNTTLHTEHGFLAMLLFGAWLSSQLHARRR